jgi:DNA polymerase alpha subunit B
MTVLLERDKLGEHFGDEVFEAPEVLTECESMLRLYSLTAQELFFKWESFCLNKGMDDTKISLSSARDLKRELQDRLEQESLEKKLQNVSHTQHRTPAHPAAPKPGK